MDTQELLKKSTQTAQRAAQSIGGTFTQGVGFTPNDTLTKAANGAGVEIPPISPSLNVSQIESAQSITSPKPVQTPRSSDSLIASIADVQSAVPDDTEASALERRIAELTRAQAGETAATLEASERLGIPDIEAEIRDISADISRRRAQLSKTIAGIGQQGYRDAAVQGQEARARGIAAAEIEALSAAQAAAQGNLLTAMSSVERAVLAKYGPIKEELAIQQQLLEQQTATMTRKEKKLAETREAELAQIQAQITQAQSREQEAMTLITEALKNGFDPRQAAQLQLGIINGTIDPLEALMQAGEYITTPGGTDMTKLEFRELDDGRTVAIDPFTGEIVKDIGGSEAMAIDPQQAQTTLSTLERDLEALNRLATDPNVEASSGKSRGFLFLKPGVTKQSKQDFLDQMDYVIKNMVFDKLTDLKAGGASFGALSEGELRAIGNAANVIASKAEYDNDGKLKGFRGSEGELKKAINDIKDTLKTSKENLEIKYLESQASPEQQQQIQSISIAPKSVLDAIAEVESEGSGGYSARGVVVTKGQYKGERALGRYQIMPGNLASWSREAIGRVVSEREFMNSPQLQDIIAGYHLQRLAEQYGSYEDAASAWLTGKPLAKAGSARDDLGTDARTYVNKFNRARNNLI